MGPQNHLAPSSSLLVNQLDAFFSNDPSLTCCLIFFDTHYKIYILYYPYFLIVVSSSTIYNCTDLSFCVVGSFSRAGISVELSSGMMVSGFVLGSDISFAGKACSKAFYQQGI